MNNRHNVYPSIPPGVADAAAAYFVARVMVQHAGMSPAEAFRFLEPTGGGEGVIPPQADSPDKL